jgi:hypothetical protein
MSHSEMINFKGCRNMKVIHKDTDDLWIHNFTNSRIFVGFMFDDFDMTPLVPGVNRFHLCCNNLKKYMNREGKRCEALSLCAPSQQIRESGSIETQVQLNEVQPIDSRTQAFYVTAGSHVPTLFELAKCQFTRPIEELPLVQIEQPTPRSQFITFTQTGEYDVMVKSCCCSSPHY